MLDYLTLYHDLNLQQFHIQSLILFIPLTPLLNTLASNLYHQNKNQF